MTLLLCVVSASKLVTWVLLRCIGVQQRGQFWHVTNCKSPAFLYAQGLFVWLRYSSIASWMTRCTFFGGGAV